MKLSCVKCQVPVEPADFAPISDLSGGVTDVTPPREEETARQFRDRDVADFHDTVSALLLRWRAPPAIHLGVKVIATSQKIAAALKRIVCLIAGMLFSNTVAQSSLVPISPV